MSNLQPNCSLTVDFQKVDQLAGGKWLIHDTNRHKDNQLHSLKLPCRISMLSSFMWHKGVRWHQIEYSERRPRGKNILRGERLQNLENISEKNQNMKTFME